MNINDFKRILTSFADKPADLELEKGQLLTEIRGELIEAKITLKDGILFVQENDIEEKAISWIKNRIACLPQLADRIIDYIPSDKTFVNPCGRLLDELEFDADENEKDIKNSLEGLVRVFDRKTPGTSSIVYLTSDAGEGKTTLISNLANSQAQKFKAKKSDWLLLPIPLGGRPFLRFDDIVIASIVNNLRFRYFYYDSFIELVKLGLIVPAFDGFEEMFMQSSTGEALSATGELINKLSSSGSILIAARKAYFDYKSFSSQAKLFDTIKSSVSFAKLAIHRWDKEQFLEYAEKRGIEDAEDIYELVKNKLNNSKHPILTRPVLVKQLIDVFQDLGTITELISKLESAINYFPIFVNAIIEREANLKWVDTSGQPYKPILSVQQHYELLSLLAEEMWLNSSESLKDNVLDLISELFSEQKKFTIQTNRQIKERLKQHALIVRTDPNNPNYQFDHEEFKEFFLGISIADKMLNNQILEVKNILKKCPLPYQTTESIVSRLKSKSKNFNDIKLFIDSVIKAEGQVSFVKENAGNILIRLLNTESFDSITVINYEFPMNALLIVKLNNVIFENCHFQNTSLNESKIDNCNFINCQFDGIETSDSTCFKDVKIIDSSISAVYEISKDKGFYDNYSIGRFLGNKGVIIESSSNEAVIQEVPEIIEDSDLELTEKSLRRFIRSNNPINDNIFKLRLGQKYDYFFKNIIPDLLRQGILIELEYLGQGQGRRFKLGVSFGQIEIALSKCNGTYTEFIDQFKKK